MASWLYPTTRRPSSPESERVWSGGCSFAPGLMAIYITGLWRARLQLQARSIVAHLPLLCCGARQPSLNC